ncbi:MAG: hypothetical protein Q8P41_16480 [Pseudomonadota bacterium]|nr:hypothetical protein [Pseudomonadota bacterium]
MPIPSFNDPGTYNVRDLDTGLLVGKVHVEPPNVDAAGGRGNVVHWAIIKSSIGDQNWGVWAKPNQQNGKQWKWEGTGESLATFLGWMNTNKGNVRYVFQGTREQDVVP